ncbi:MAG: MFS transporter [Dokdonella sp.]
MSATTDADEPTGWRAIISGANAQERKALLWSFLFFFSQLFGYYILRSVREALISVDGSALIPRVFTSVFVCMLLLMPLYGALVARVARRHFMPVIYVFVIVMLVGFAFVADRSMNSNIALAFAIFLSVINLFTDAVFWSFMADIFVNRQAKRFYAIIAAGGTIGAILGPIASLTLVAHVNAAGLMLISAFFYANCLYCLTRLIPWTREQEHAQGREDGEALIGGSIIGGAKLIGSSPILIALVLHLFFGVSIGTFLYNSQADLVKSLDMDYATRNQYFALIDLTMNVVVLLVQVLVTRFLLTRFGVTPLLLIPAVLVGIGLGSLALAHGALLLSVVQIGTRGLSFAFVKPARETLFTLVDREARYKSKNFIDTLVYRGGDMVSSWAYLALGAIGFGVAARAGIWAGVAVVWLAVVIWLIRVQRGLHDARQADPSDDAEGR